jgi:D-methionine transport system ATP-binding protein
MPNTATIHVAAPVQTRQVTAAAQRPIVLLDRVGKIFDTATGPLAALENVTLSIDRGEIFGVIGRSGAGKSTLIRIVNRLEEATSGSVFVNGVDMRSLGKRELELQRRRIGMIFQHFNLLSAKTIADNVALPLRVSRTPKAKIKEKVEDLLDLVGLSEKRGAYPAKLSGGQRQRAGIARALAHDPAILLCDEATSALDPETTHAILALLKKINHELGLTIILITHEMSVISEICDQVAVLDSGRIVEQGPVWKVFGRPIHETTHALLRTASRALPAELAAQLQLRDGPENNHVALVELNFPEFGSSGVDIGPLAHFSDGSIRLVHGGIDRIQGRSRGRLIVSISAQKLEERLDKLRRSSIEVRVLGYVNSAA